MVFVVGKKVKSNVNLISLSKFFLYSIEIRFLTKQVPPNLIPIFKISTLLHLESRIQLLVKLLNSLFLKSNKYITLKSKILDFVSSLWLIFSLYFPGISSYFDFKLVWLLLICIISKIFESKSTNFRFSIFSFIFISNEPLADYKKQPVI